LLLGEQTRQWRAGSLDPLIFRRWPDTRFRLGEWTTMPEAADCPLSDDDVVAFVAEYSERGGFGCAADVGLDTRLTELGLDSIAIIVMVVEARDELVATGRLPETATLRDIPQLGRIADVAALLRSLCSDCG
jgi:acyl carrier protein